jgi:hypothetical protein
MDKRNISVSNRSTNVARTVFVSPPWEGIFWTDLKLVKG